MKKRRPAVSVLIALSLLGVAGWRCQPDRNAGRGEFRTAYGRTIDDLPFYVGIEEGFFRDEGLVVEQVLVDKSANALAALFKNEIQCCELSFSDIVFAAHKKLPIKVIVWMGRAHVRTRCGFHVRRDSDIYSVADLKGHAIALGGAISSRIITMTLLKKAGLGENDVRLVLGLELNDPMKLEAALKSRKVDLVLC